jgi:hypothetical protein
VKVVASFPDVAQQQRAFGRTVRQFTEPTGEGYLFEVRLREGERERKHLFGARQVVTPEGAWVALTVQIAPIARLDFRRALLANAALPIGSLAVTEKHVVLRQTLPLGALPAEQLERTILAMAQTASLLHAAAETPIGAESDAPFAYAFR